MTFDIENAGTLLIPDDSLPWVPFEPYSGLVHIKVFRADPVRGEVITAVRASPGVELPRVRHSGMSVIYTVQGRWKYREHDWVAGPGSVVIENAGARHTPQVLADGTDDAIMFAVSSGDVHMFDADGNVIGVETWRTIVDRYVAYCRDRGLVPRALTGIAA